MTTGNGFHRPQAAVQNNATVLVSPQYAMPTEQTKWREPLYDLPCGSGQDGGGFALSVMPVVVSKQGPLRLPPGRARGFATPTPDFVRIMKSLEFHPADEEVRRALPQLSQEFYRLRSALKEQAARCDIDTYFAYLILLKKLSRYFETADCVFDTYYGGGGGGGTPCNNPQSCHFVYEYMQALLLTGARLCEQASARYEANKASADDYLVASYVYEELVRTAEYCQGERLFRSGRWLYQASPDAIGSAHQGGVANIRQAQHQATASRESATLRNFVRYDLHGVEALAMRALLCRARMTEVGVGLLRAQLDNLASTADTEQRCLKVYEKLAPLMLCCRQYYDTIVRNTAGSPAPHLLNYAHYHSYHWYVQQEWIQARAEWQCFNDSTVLDFDTYGRRAVRRLCVLRDSLTQKEQWVAQLGPDAALQRDWDQLKKQVLQLYDDVRTKAPSTLWASGGAGVTIPEIQAYQPPPPDEQHHNLLAVYSEKWAQLSQLPQYAPLVKVFDFLQQLASPNQPAEGVLSSSSSSSSSTASTASNTISQSTGSARHEQQLENYRIMGLAEERWTHLDWLVSQIDQDGTIFIDQEACDYLRQQLALTNQFIAQHDIVFTTAKQGRQNYPHQQYTQ